MMIFRNMFFLIAAVLSFSQSVHAQQTQAQYLAAALTTAVQNNDLSWCPTGTYRTLVSIDGGAPQCVTITGYEPACTPPGWNGGAMAACTVGSGAGAVTRWKAMNPTAAAPVMLCNLVGGLAGKNAAAYNTWQWTQCSANQAATPATIPETSFLARFGTSTTPVLPAAVQAAAAKIPTTAPAPTFVAAPNACGGNSCTFPGNPIPGSQAIAVADNASMTAACEQVCRTSTGCNALTVYQGWCNIFSTGPNGANAPSQSAPVAKFTYTSTGGTNAAPATTAVGTTTPPPATTGVSTTTAPPATTGVGTSTAAATSPMTCPANTYLVWSVPNTQPAIPQLLSPGSFQCVSGVTAVLNTASGYFGRNQPSQGNAEVNANLTKAMQTRKILCIKTEAAEATSEGATNCSLVAYFSNTLLPQWSLGTLYGYAQGITSMIPATCPAGKKQISSNSIICK